MCTLLSVCCSCSWSLWLIRNLLTETFNKWHLITAVPKSKIKMSEHWINIQHCSSCSMEQKTWNLGFIQYFIRWICYFLLKFSVYKIKVILPSSEGSYEVQLLTFWNIQMESNILSCCVPWYLLWVLLNTCSMKCYEPLELDVFIQ